MVNELHEITPLYSSLVISRVLTIASELKSELYCDIVNIHNMFYFGTPSSTSYELEDTIYYKAHKNLKRYHEAGGTESGHDTDYFYYEIEKKEQYNVGDEIYFKNKKLYVNQYSAYALKDEVIYKYKLCRKNGIWQTKLYNSLIGGAALEGKVLAVDGEKVKLHLNIDETQNEDEAAWFPYAPPTGNIMYSMPVVGTSARLYFPNEESEEPIVTGCVRSNGSSCAKTSDTTKRYFGTEHGSEIEMTPGAVNIKGGSKEPLSLSIDENVGVTLKSSKNLNLNADDDIIIKTPASVKLKAQSQIGVTKTGAESGFSLETDMHIKGGNVIKDGSDRETYAPFDDEPREGKKPDPPAPPQEEKKPFDWGKLATNVLAGLAVVALVTVAAVAIAATCGAAAPVIGSIALGAAVAGTLAVGSKAASDINRGEVSDISDYIGVAAKDSLAGAICGAIFAPFEAVGVGAGLLGEMPTTAQLVGNFVKTMGTGGLFNYTYYNLRELMDGRIPNLEKGLEAFRDGTLFSGYLHVGLGAISEVSPFIKNAFSKVSGEISDNMKALKYAWDNFEMPKDVKLGSNLGNLDLEGLKSFANKYKEGMNEIKNPSVGGEYSTEEWYKYLKEKYGEDNVYLCTDEKSLINSVSEKLDNYRKNINGGDYAKSAVAYDGNNLDTVSMATSNSHQYNPTILTDGEKFDVDMFNKMLGEHNGKESVAYSKYYEQTLTEDYIKSLPDEYFTSKGSVKDDVISEMKKLTDAIENTKNEARIEEKSSELTGEPSFKDWNVENCAEVWSTRKAILNGAKFDDISFKCVETTSGNYAKPCENCKRTFGNLNNVGKVK